MIFHELGWAEIKSTPASFAWHIEHNCTLGRSVMTHCTPDCFLSGTLSQNELVVNPFLLISIVLGLYMFTEYVIYIYINSLLKGESKVFNLEFDSALRPTRRYVRSFSILCEYENRIYIVAASKSGPNLEHNHEYREQKISRYCPFTFPPLSLVRPESVLRRLLLSYNYFCASPPDGLWSAQPLFISPS
jgi:hypothetical protein